MYESLRDYLDKLEKEGYLLRIKKEIENGEEIFTILWKLAEKGKDDLALIFENIKGYTIPIVANIFGSDSKRWALAFGLKNTMSIKELRNFVISKIEQKNEWKKPILISSSEAPTKEVILKGNEIDLFNFPILEWHPNDNGRYVTYGLAITKDETYGVNVGIYRMMVLDRNKLTIMCSPYQHIGIYLEKAKKEGEKYLECAVTIGNIPALIIAGFTKLKIRENEMEFAAALNGGQPVKLVKCETVNLEVPADSEIVIEGRISVENFAPEGTFGEYMGYHEEKMEYPVFEISCITHRRNPFYLTTIVSHHRADGEALFRSVVQNAHFYRELKRAEIPGFVDCWLPLYGHGFVGIVSVNKKFRGWGRQLLYKIFGIPFVAATINCLILVDDDIDPANLDEVIWALGTRVDPYRDVVITKPIAMYGLNPAASVRVKPPETSAEISLISRMLIDATLKAEEDGLQRKPPIPVKVRKEMVQTVEAKWKEYGFVE